ncbi:MAG: hypothetical protein AAF466_04150 [Bacteroidota bacterium]
MKKTLVLFTMLLAVAVYSCKNAEEKTETPETDPNITEQVEDGYQMYTGEFLYSEAQKSGVLMGSNFIYGVVIDDKAKELGAQVANVKKDSLDMVPVVIRGEVMPNPDLQEEGSAWKEVITIKEIIAVSEKPSEADIKIEESTN